MISTTATTDAFLLEPPESGKPASSSALVEEPAGLCRILEPHLNFCVLRRDVASELEDFVREVLLSREMCRSLICATADPDLEELLQGIPHSDGLAAFRADLLAQVRWFGSFIRAPQVQIKLESTGKDLCERFHVDQVPLRSICTYEGPATEWLDNAAVNRSKLGPGSGGQRDEESGLLLPGARIQQLPRLAVGWMKGGLWPGNAGSGLVHRSPRVRAAGLRRVFFKIDLHLPVIDARGSSSLVLASPFPEDIQ